MSKFRLRKQARTKLGFLQSLTIFRHNLDEVIGVNLQVAKELDVRITNLLNEGKW